MHASFLDRHAEWPKLNHNTIIKKALACFLVRNCPLLHHLQLIRTCALPSSIHHSGFKKRLILSLLCRLSRSGAPANLKHLCKGFLCGGVFL